jgi:hypothetical protein
MTPEEKAKELVDKYSNPFDRNGCIPPSEALLNATLKQCALIAVDEMYNIAAENDNVKQMNYLIDVKQEIEKL